jgi:hypothetical protein
MRTTKEGIRWPLYTSFVFLLIVVLSLILHPTSFFGKNQEMAQTAAAEASSSFATYDNSQYGIKILYPTDWHKVEGGFLNRIVDVKNNTLPVAAFYSPDCSVGVDIAKQKLLKRTTLNQYINENIVSLKKDQPVLRVIESNNITLAGLPAHKIVVIGLFDIAGALKRSGLDQLIGNMINFRPVNATTMEVIALHGDAAYVLGYSDASGKVMDQISNILSGLSSGSSNLCSLLGGLSSGAGGLSSGAGDLLSNSTSSDLQSKYSQYLPTAQQMFDSFQITSRGTNNSTVVSSNATHNPCQDLLGKLNSRLVNGEITSQQYDEIRKKIGC